MKGIIITAIVLGITFSSNAGGSAYEKTMGKTIGEMYATNDLAAFDQVANKFARIGDAEKSEWLPYYYGALTYTFKAFRINDLQEKDAVLDQALVVLDKAYAIEANNSEVISLHGFINMIKIGVDPGTRGQSLSPGIYADFGKAMKLDPKNPRATLFMAQMQYGTAQFFGSGVEEACQMVESSIVLFESTEGEESLMPSWGKDSAFEYRNMCQAPSSNE